MTDFGNAVLFTLTNNAGVNTIISGRVYRVRLPQEVTLPAVTFQLVSSIPQMIHGEATKNFINRYQVDCWATGGDAVSALRDAVVAAMDNIQGTISGVNVLRILFEGDRDNYEDQPEMYRRILEFTMFNET